MLFKVVKLTADNIEAALNQIEISDIEKIVVTVLNESNKTIDNLDEIVSKTIEEFRRQQTAEQQKSKYDDGFAENKERIVSLCSTISDIFMEQYNADRHILNTNLAFTELSERCTLADVKSVIAAAIIDHKNGIKEGRLTAKTEDWAASQVLSDSVESYIEKYGSVVCLFFGEC